jgi:riboflavin biosynthesis pyrimidine reductase
MLTVAPLLVAGDGPTALTGAALDPPPRLTLRDVHRADDHLFLHYATGA